MADEKTTPLPAEASAPGPVPVAPVPVKPVRTSKPRKAKTVTPAAPVALETSVSLETPPATLDQALAQIEVMNLKLESLHDGLGKLQALVIAQTTLLKVLAQSKSAPVKSATPVNGLAEIGERNARVQCAVIGRDGKPHGMITVNRFKNCPDCYNEAHFQALTSPRKAA